MDTNIPMINNSKQLLPGLWVIAKSGNSEYIGRLVSQNNEPLTDKAQTFNLLGQYRDWMGLNPVYDFMAPVERMTGPDGSPGLTRRPIIMPHQFQTTDAVYYVKVDGLQFFDDLSKDDQGKYESMAQAAAEALLYARAQSSGVHLAKSLG